MSQTHHPFAVPHKLPSDLDRVLAYWEGLKRGAAEMPFWDDVNLGALPDLEGRLMLIDVFQEPERFRFAIVGKDFAGQKAEGGAFLDSVTSGPPLDYLRAQCSATVEAAGPTAHTGGGKPDDGGRYIRLLLPLWGEGQVRMILGAVAPG